jgi:hypothetical protein
VIAGCQYQPNEITRNRGQILNRIRRLLIILVTLGLLVGGIIMPRPTQAQTLYYQTPVAGYVYLPVFESNFYSHTPPGYYLISPAPGPCKHGYKPGWKGYHKHKIKYKHKNKYKNRW